ncbi:MAG: MATE family efflux transporter [Christensenella sp.]|uniref:MATE family efflux transporter n=1 Tax=Christensenella sp. TaxID=1935934 RepID=UPI002B21BF53|nr:MATE family efflux transporter [Christensenella sp.]MEA5003203.1 MATE family efflux transporter [Christensenella sp.]
MGEIRENKMGVMPVKKLLVTMSLPIMISMLVQALYNIVDSVFVGQYSESAFAAVSLAFPLQMLIIAVAVGTGVGINSLLSRRLGEKKFEDASKAATNGIFLGILSWVAFALIGIFFSRMFFESFTAGLENGSVIADMGTQYLSICLIFSFGVFIQIVCERILQSTGITIFNMIMQLIGAGINIVLDPILIFGIGPFPEMGAAGAAIATVIGQIVAMGFGLYFVKHKVKEVKVTMKKFRPSGRIIKEIYKVGIPSIIMQALVSVMNVGFNFILVGFSAAAVSVLGAYFRLQSFIFMPVFGLTNGMIPIVAYNYGARHRQRILDTVKFAVFLSVAIMIVGMVAFQLFPAQLLEMFNATPAMLEIGVSALRIISLCFAFAGVGIVFSCVFQAVGNGMLSMLVSLCRQIVVLLPVAYILAQIGGVHSVWYSFPVAECVSLVLSIVFYKYVYKRYLKNLDNPLVEVPGM